MEKFFAEALKIRSFIGAAVLALLVVALFREQLATLAGTNPDAFSNLAAFLFFTLLGIVGIAAFFAISKSEIDKGSVSVCSSKKVKSTVSGGGTVDVRDSEDVETSIQNPPAATAADPEKKTP